MLPLPHSIAEPAPETDLETIRQFNRTERAFPDQAVLLDLIERSFDQHSLKTAVICDHDQTFGCQNLTFGQLNGKANQLARLLRAEGVRPGEIVGIMLERSFSMIIGILGILKAGGAYLPLSPDNPPDRNSFMLQDCGARFLLVQKKTKVLADFPGRRIEIDDVDLYQGDTANLPVVNKPEDLLYVIYTSGSTGKPKGVMVERRSVVNRLNWMQSAYPIGPEDCILQKTPFYFDVSVWELFWWALTGAKLCVLTPGAERLPMMMAETIRKHRITLLHFVPSMLSVFLEYLENKGPAIRQSLSGMKRVFASGEALQPGHVRKFNALLGRSIGAKLTNLYGPTEATVDVSYYDCPEDDDFKIIPIGRPIDNTRFYIIEEGQQRTIGESGELCIAGVGLARGYINNPALTNTKFIDNPHCPGERIYRTGDIARWLPDGNIEYLGRADTQVKIRGLRIELGEIENTIREFRFVSDCVAIVKAYSESVILIVAYVVPKVGLSLESLKEHLKQRLPDYMIPNAFELINEIPLGPTGKANRAALPAPSLQLKRPSNGK